MHESEKQKKYQKKEALEICREVSSSLWLSANLLVKLGKELPGRPKNSEFIQGYQQFILPQAKMEIPTCNILAMDRRL